jgi:hypothetical protein
LLVAAANDAGGRDNVTALIGGLPAAAPVAGGGRFAIPAWGSLTAALAGGLLLLVVALVAVRAFTGGPAVSTSNGAGGRVPPGSTTPTESPSPSVAPLSVAAPASPTTAATPAPAASALASSPLPPLRAPASPLNFSATAQGSHEILLRWAPGPVDASHSAPTGYRIVEYRSLPEWQGLGGVQALEAPPRTIGSPLSVGPDVRNHTMVGLAVSTTYCYAVYAQNAAGSSHSTEITCVGLPPVFYAWALSLGVGGRATTVRVGKAVEITARAELLLPPSAAGEYPLTKWTVSEVDAAGQATVVKTCSTTSSSTQTCRYQARFLSPTTMQFKVDGYTRERDWADPLLKHVQVTITWNAP